MQDFIAESEIYGGLCLCQRSPRPQAADYEQPPRTEIILPATPVLLQSKLNRKRYPDVVDVSRSQADKPALGHAHNGKEDPLRLIVFPTTEESPPNTFCQ